MKQVESTAVPVFTLTLALTWPVPLVWLVGTASSKPTFHMTFLPNSRFIFGSLSYIWNAIPFARYCLSTLILVVVTFCIQFVTSALAVYALVIMDLKGQALVFAVTFIQIIIPNDTLVTPNFMILADLGLTDTKVGIMLSSFGSAPAILLLGRYFKPIPKALIEAARIGGANTWQTTWKVYMLYTKPAYVFFAVISISYYWNNCLWSLIVTNSPPNRTLTIGLAIFAKSKKANMQWTSVRVVAFITILPLLIAFFFLQEQSMSSLISAGIKE